MAVTKRELEILGVKLGLVVEGARRAAEDMIKLDEDREWAYEQHYKTLRVPWSVAEQWAARVLYNENKTKFSVQHSFDFYGNAGPLIATLRGGKADAELQAWIADQIESGGFRRNKSKIQRMLDLGPLADAVLELPHIERVLRERGPARGARKRAVEIVALNNRLHVSQIKDYLRRSRKGPNRPI